MHEELKEKLGIKNANCSTCSCIDDVGDGPEYNGSWLVCSKIARMGNLKSFPFKKDMKCWQPSFWHSKFTDFLDGTGESEVRATNAWRSAIGLPPWKDEDDV
jgi:hypothetical protein